MMANTDQLQDAVDQRVAQRDQRVGAALGEPVERELDEGVGVQGERV